LCVCGRERERERYVSIREIDGMWMSQRERKKDLVRNRLGEYVCVCVCVCVREREG